MARLFVCYIQALMELMCPRCHRNAAHKCTMCRVSYVKYMFRNVFAIMVVFTGRKTCALLQRSLSRLARTQCSKSTSGATVDTCTGEMIVGMRYVY